MLPTEKTALLGVNIDHVATLRQLRSTPYPDLIEAADLVLRAGAGQITVHLREDRRHIQDADVKRLRPWIEGRALMNLEIATTDAMVKIAAKTAPHWSCLVPERRQEVTTEGGLDLKKGAKRIAAAIAKLQKSRVKVSLFIEPSLDAVKKSAELGADAVELHTGRYCIETQKAKKSAAAIQRELGRIEKAASLAVKLGLRAHAGHGFDFENVRPVAAFERADRRPLIEEFNIGHAIVCRAALVGLERSVREMKAAIEAP